MEGEGEEEEGACLQRAIARKQRPLLESVDVCNI